jgi:hypothetical protein
MLAPSQLVDRLPCISDDELLAKYIRPGVPVVLTQATADWPAHKKWSLSYLKEVAGDVQVPIRGNRQRYRLLATRNVAEYVGWLQGERRDHLLDSNRTFAPYVAHNRGLTPRLAQDLDFASLGPRGYAQQTPALWIGPAGAETPLHYDAIGIVLYAQIVGRKEVVLFPRQQSKYLYEGKYFDFTTCYSRINLQDVDLRRYPRFAQARPWKLVLEPGELLIFPDRTWHEFRALDPSISVVVHAGTERDYSSWNPLLLKERAKQGLHWFGLYARNACGCHSITDVSEWDACMRAASNALTPPHWIRASPVLDRLVRGISARSLHDRELADIFHWRAGAAPSTLQGVR